MSNEKRINKQLKLDIAFFIPLSLCKKVILIPDFTRDGRGLTNKRLSEKNYHLRFFLNKLEISLYEKDGWDV